MDIKDRIKSNRIALGLTMKELSEKVGVSECTISRWESGDIENMRRDKIAALSQTLGISPLEILGFADPFQSASDQISTAANFFDLCLGRIGWTREWDDDKGKYAFRKNDVVVYFSADEYAELSDGIEKSVEDAILSAIREKIIK